jgi:hypothetical protein
MGGTRTSDKKQKGATDPRRGFQSSSRSLLAIQQGFGAGDRVGSPALQTPAAVGDVATLKQKVCIVYIRMFYSFSQQFACIAY